MQGFWPYRRGTTPIDVPSQTIPLVGQFGVAYIEFYPPGGPAAQLNLILTITKQWGKANPKVSVIPIANFQTHPPNTFIIPVADATGQNLLYSQIIPSFHNYRRVAVIISNPSPNASNITFMYSSNIAIR